MIRMKIRMEICKMKQVVLGRYTLCASAVARSATLPRSKETRIEG